MTATFEVAAFPAAGQALGSSELPMGQVVFRGTVTFDKDTAVVNPVLGVTNSTYTSATYKVGYKLATASNDTADATILWSQATAVTAAAAPAALHLGELYDIDRIALNLTGTSSNVVSVLATIRRL
jgi:hypothetical protein